MNPIEKPVPLRVLFLITSPALSGKVSAIFNREAVPIRYSWTAKGTASGEMIDILGLGSPERSVLISMLPKTLADGMLKTLKKELRLGAVDSGIAFSVPVSGTNNLIMRIMEKLSGDTAAGKDEITVTDSKYSLIAAVVNQGYSEEVMDAARSSGAGGGTVVHSRRIGSEEVMSLWGMSIQEEKEMIFIVAEKESKRNIMQAIGEKCGIHSEAEGIVVSLPIESVLGFD